MPTQRYSITPHPIRTILSWVESGEIAIPEIQRPFVWDSTKVRNLLDSLLRGYPVGYLIAWRNPTVRLKDGSSSMGKRILIDGQQRVTALMAAVLGREVVNQDYEQVRIRIAYHPGERKFEVSNPAIQKDAAWIPDIAAVFDPRTKLLELVKAYCARNAAIPEDDVFRAIEDLKGITSNHLGIIELDSELTVETVTDIFIRVNSAGKPLSQADFAMSKIATNESYGGNQIRKAIDYFCHLAVAPEFYDRIRNNDPAFVETEFFERMAWLRKENDNIYDPSYTDMLRVAFTSEFKRGRLEQLVALLSGRNFETKQYEEAIAEQSFASLKRGILNFMSETDFKRFLMIIRSAGFIDADLIGGQNALNVAYIVYLMLRQEKLAAADIERGVRRWFVFSVLTGRYSSNPETTLDFDVKQMRDHGFDAYANTVIAGELSDAFWTAALPQGLVTSATSGPYFRLFQAAQAKVQDRGFLSRDITVDALILNRGDVHHLFPKNHLKGLGKARGSYNQIANFALAQSEINIAIGDVKPSVYFGRLAEQVSGGKRHYGAITGREELLRNLRAHCIPERMLDEPSDDYEWFLTERRKLMAEKLRGYFESL